LQKEAAHNGKRIAVQEFINNPAGAPSPSEGTDAFLPSAPAAEFQEYKSFAKEARKSSQSAQKAVSLAANMQTYIPPQGSTFDGTAFSTYLATMHQDPTVSGDSCSMI
jgi:hypothetical protein